MRISRLLAVAALAAALAIGAPTARAGDGLVYTGDVPATMGFMRDLAVLFEAQTGIEVALHIGDTSTAIRATARGESDLGGTTRPALEDPRESGVTLYPIAWDALAVITHPDNPVDNLSLAQLGGILRGDVAGWQAVGGGDAPIVVHLPADPLSGVGYNLRMLLFDSPDAKLAAGRPGPDLKAVERAVASDPGALGVTSLASVRGEPVKILRIEGVRPSADSLVAGDYLLYQPLHLAARGADGLTERFVRFAQSPLARRILRRNGAVPYMDGLNLVRHQFDRENRLRRAEIASPR